MKDYTLKEAKEILKKYFNLLPQTDDFKYSLCQTADCEDCLFCKDACGQDCETSIFENENIIKAEQYIKNYNLKPDWKNVPIGTKVKVWDNIDGSDKENHFIHSFLGFLDGELWAVHPDAGYIAYSWNYMEVAED